MPEECSHPGCDKPRHREGGHQCLEHGCRCCGGVILADTEDWPSPLCYWCLSVSETNRAQIVEFCGKCYSRGYVVEEVEGTESDYIPDRRERYCDCPAGVRLRERGG